MCPALGRPLPAPLKDLPCPAPGRPLSTTDSTHAPLAPARPLSRFNKLFFCRQPLTPPGSPPQARLRGLPGK